MKRLLLWFVLAAIAITCLVILAMMPTAKGATWGQTPTPGLSPPSTPSTPSSMAPIDASSAMPSGTASSTPTQPLPPSTTTTSVPKVSAISISDTSSSTSTPPPAVVATAPPTSWCYIETWVPSTSGSTGQSGTFKQGYHGPCSQAQIIAAQYGGTLQPG